MLANTFKYFLTLLSIFCKNKEKINLNKSYKINIYLIKKLKQININSSKLKTHEKLSSTIKKIIIEKKLINFLRNQFIQNIFFIHNRFFIKKELLDLKKDKMWKLWNKLLIENPVGNPIKYFLYCKSSGNRIRQVYLVKKIFEERQIDIKKINSIIEIGGGYGCMAQIFHKINKNIEYTIYDLNEVNLLQYYYLKMNNLEPSLENNKKKLFLTNNLNFLKKRIKNNTIIIANWSLSEFPLKLRWKLLPLFLKSKLIMISFQDKFENINNIKFFKKFSKKLKKKFDYKIKPFQYYNSSILNKSNHYYYLFFKK